VDADARNGYDSGQNLVEQICRLVFVLGGEYGSELLSEPAHRFEVLLRGGPRMPILAVPIAFVASEEVVEFLDGGQFVGPCDRFASVDEVDGHLASHIFVMREIHLTYYLGWGML
jgi:hypothetical protein